MFDNLTDSCTTNFSIGGQPQPCTEAVATSVDLFHFVFDQVEQCKIVIMMTRTIVQGVNFQDIVSINFSLSIDPKDKVGYLFVNGIGQCHGGQ